MQTHRIAAAVVIAAIALLAICGQASAKWTQVPYPVLRPTLTWETTAVSEPTVMWDRGRYRLWYTGGWYRCYIGYAESLDGVHWAKWNRPLLANACHSHVVKINRKYVIYSVPDSGRPLQITTSSDGIHMGRTRPIMNLRPAMWDDERFANTFVIRDRSGWTLLYEVMSTTTRLSTTWQMGEVKGNPFNWWPHAPQPKWVGFGGMAGGPWRDDNCLYYHASASGLLPTDIYRRCGPMDDLGPHQPVLHRQYPWEVDQVADPTIARRPGHKPLMLFSAMDNPNHRGLIAAAFETR